MKFSNGPIYSSAKLEKSFTKMALKVNVKLPPFITDRDFKYENRTLSSYKIHLESTLSNIFIQNILCEKYFKTTIEINIEVYEFSCDFTHYAVMAISQTLMNANIEQKGVISCAKLVNLFSL